MEENEISDEILQNQQGGPPKRSLIVCVDRWPTTGIISKTKLSRFQKN